MGDNADGVSALRHKYRGCYEDDAAQGHGPALHKLRRNVARHDVGARRPHTAARKGQLPGG